VGFFAGGFLGDFDVGAFPAADLPAAARLGEGFPVAALPVVAFSAMPFPAVAATAPTALAVVVPVVVFAPLAGLGDVGVIGAPSSSRTYQA
jgi:hypothetical protein